MVEGKRVKDPDIVSTPNELQQSVVRIIVDGSPRGTGFMVAPRRIITCAHVVTSADAEVKVEWEKSIIPARLNYSTDSSYPDLAMLEINTDEHPCVVLGEEVRSSDPLYIFGFPLSMNNPLNLMSTGVRAVFESVSYLDAARKNFLLSFKKAQIVGGMSGSPVLNEKTKKVCGIVNRTRD